LSPDPALVERAARLVRNGAIVALPTDTFYGLAADPFSVDAVSRIFIAKGRSHDQALPLVAADAAQIEAQLGALPDGAARLAARFWPGPLTLLLEAPSSLAPAVSAGTSRVGVRVPAHEVTRALCRAAGTVLTATSANPSGEAATDDPDVVERSLGAALAALVDAGRTPGGQPSTIVDVTGGEPRLIRSGAIRWEEVLACLKSA
jgi:L-threonylcarbamoyladenylate synthase